MKTRIVWSRAELIKVGMEFDRLKSDPTVRLLPDTDILRLHAQLTLPLERRRSMTQQQALDVLSRIDAMRDKQEHTEWIGAENTAPVAVDLPTDSLELLAINATRRDLQRMETNIMHRIETLMQESERRMQEFILAQLANFRPSDTVKVPVVPVATVNKQKVLVLYPGEASWAANVPSGIAALRRENWDVIATAIDAQNSTHADVQAFDVIFTIDAVKTNLCLKRVQAMLKSKGLDVATHNFHCATREQIISQVKAALLAAARKAA